MTEKSSPTKTPRKPILSTPARYTPKALTAPKSVTIQSEPTDAMPAPIPNPTPMKMPILVHAGARPKTHRADRPPLLPPTALPSPSQPQPLVPRRILSYTPSGENGEDVDRRGALIRDHEEKRQILRDQNRKIFHQPPKEGMDIGITEGLETLDPEIRIPTDEDFVLPPPLESLLDKSKTAYEFLPKQGYIDRLIAKINKNVPRDTSLYVDLRDLKVAYLTSPHLRDIYLYLLQNRIASGKGVAKWLDQNARNYLILDGLLFKILDDGEGNLDTVLYIPTSKVHILLNAYHSSILGGHTGITKCYHTINQRCYCPNLEENLRAYITGCHVCQMFKKGKRPYQKRINLNVPVMTKISMDIKQMPVNKGYSHILVLLLDSKYVQSGTQL